MIKLALTAITSFSYFPLQLSTWVGAFLAGIGFLLMVLFIILRAVGSAFLAGQALTVILVVFLSGVQLLSLGILGEYIGRIYDEVKGRPLYTTSEAPSDEK
jgi:dolichol-phosphate mannosyltransferase